MGYSLCDSYGDLWAYTTGDTGMAAMNTRESIFEVQWTSQTSGSWMWMMFTATPTSQRPSRGPVGTPSRNLTRAYNAAGDTERLNASGRLRRMRLVVSVSSDEYAFMHKFPTNVTPVYVIVWPTSKLLHAEALANSGDPAAPPTSWTRSRPRRLVADRRAARLRDAKCAKRCSTNAASNWLWSFRWFDLMRYGDYSKLIEVCDGVNVKGSSSYDSYFKVRRAMNDNRVLLPIPTSVLDDNTNISNRTWVTKS